METFGERRFTKTGDYSDLEILDGDEPIMRLQGAIESFNIKTTSGAVDACRLLLKFDAEQTRALLTPDTRIRVVAGREGETGEQELFRGRVDYVEAQRDVTNEPLRVELQARGPGGQLLDEGYKGSVEGAFEAVVASVTSVEPVVRCDVVPPGEFRLWADAGSVFGIVQLLAISTDMLAERRREGGFSLTTRTRVLEALREQPRITVDPSMMQKTRMRQGRPVRGIADDDSEE